MYKEQLLDWLNTQIGDVVAKDKREELANVIHTIYHVPASPKEEMDRSKVAEIMRDIAVEVCTMNNISMLELKINSRKRAYVKGTKQKEEYKMARRMFMQMCLLRNITRTQIAKFLGYRYHTVVNYQLSNGKVLRMKQAREKLKQQRKSRTNGTLFKDVA